MTFEDDFNLKTDKESKKEGRREGGRKQSKEGTKGERGREEKAGAP